MPNQLLNGKHVCPECTIEFTPATKGIVFCDSCEAYFSGYDADVYTTPAAFCDNYTVHVPHVYGAINGNTYNCPGFTAEDDARLEADLNAPACEHGLSQSLCAGPMHYPADQ